MSGCEMSSLPSRRSVAHERGERRDDAQRVAVRLHEQRVRVLGEQRAEAPDVPGRLQHPARRRDAATAGAAGSCRCQRYAGAMSASSSSQRAYDGTRYCVGKIMLRKSPPVMRTHSCGSSAPIGCIAWKPGMTSSTPSSDARATSAMRGIGVVGRGLGRRARTVDLPRERHAVRGILREEVVQDRRAGARLADDDDRRDDVDVGDLGMLLAPLDDAEAVRQIVDELARRRSARRARADAASVAQRVDEPLEAFLPGVLAEVVEAGRVVRVATSRSASSMVSDITAAS